MITNPVLTGFNADPSMVRAVDKNGKAVYYIANSTFEWFPGVQIHRSYDLENWELITHPLTTKELLDMRGDPDSGGIWAPDLTYADGLFWLVYTDVKVTEGAFKDCTNYLITAENIEGPWSAPVKLNGAGFDASLFHDDDRKKYLIQMQWDFREYNHPFRGLLLTEYSVSEKRLLPETAKIIYKGTNVKLVEGPHLYKINGSYYIFAAEGGTVYTHQEVVAKSDSLWGGYKTQPGNADNPGGAFLGAFNHSENYLQKCGHGSLIQHENGDWYFAHLTGRPLHHATEPRRDPRGFCPLGRETAIQKVEWDSDGYPHIAGGRQGARYVQSPGDITPPGNNAKKSPSGSDPSKRGGAYPLVKFTSSNPLDINLNTLREPFSEKIGSLTAREGYLRLFGLGSLTNNHDLSLVARRWQAFNFCAETAVEFEPHSFQQMAGLTCYYNSRHWTFAYVTLDDDGRMIIEVSECDRGVYTSHLRQNAIVVPDSAKSVYLKVTVKCGEPSNDSGDISVLTEDTDPVYRYQYSFDGGNWHTIGVDFDPLKLSDDYVLQSYGGFFTGAFVGVAAVDVSGYCAPADFAYFRYEETD
ncbi:glycoside hydrolase 43 family protein [Clostridia bacterium]|nr:glycoside hydrolase 43 family protein [Clostridia bacterium]